MRPVTRSSEGGPDRAREPRHIDRVLERWTALRGAYGFTFRDLLDVGRREETTVSELADWLARALTAGDVIDTGDVSPGPGRARPQRRYRAVAEQHPLDAAAS